MPPRGKRCRDVKDRPLLWSDETDRAATPATRPEGIFRTRALLSFRRHLRPGEGNGTRRRANDFRNRVRPQAVQDPAIQFERVMYAPRRNRFAISVLILWPVER